jgi:hypothetical protein
LHAADNLEVFEMTAWNRPFFVFLLASFAILAWRVPLLGFVTDDLSVLMGPQLWFRPFSAELWNALEVAQNRPVLRAFLFLLDSVVPQSTLAWHILGAVLNFGTAVALAWFVADVIRLFDPAKREVATVSGLFAGVCWLAFPFSAATQFWATGTTSVPAVAAFCVSGSLLIRNWGSFNGRIVIAIAISLAGYLTYEAFYFHFLLVVAALIWKRGLQGRSHVAILGFVGAQVAAATFSRVMRMLGADGSRGVNPNFVDVFFHWFLYVGRAVGVGKSAAFFLIVCSMVAATILFYFLLHRRGGSTRLVLSLALGVGGVGAAAVLIVLPLSFLEGAPMIAAAAGIALWRWRDRLGAPQSSEMAALVLAGICFGALPFALGNYVVFSLGPGARATLGLSIWCAMCIGWLAAVALESERRVAYVFMALLFGGLALGTLARGMEWVAAGRLMATVLNQAPAFPQPRPGDGALIVLKGPELPGWVPVVEVNHHMAAIARLAFGQKDGTPHTAEAVQTARYRWVVARDLVWHTSWDGVVFSQRTCRETAGFERIETTEVWIWDHMASSIYPIAAPYASGCR